MISYETKKNGPRPYNGAPTQTYQEGLYKSHIDSYPTYRTPVGKPKGPRSSNEVNTRQRDDGQFSIVRNSAVTNIISTHQRTNSVGSSGGDSFDLETHLDNYRQGQNNFDSTCSSYFFQETPQYQPFQPKPSLLYNSPATTSASSSLTLGKFEFEEDVNNVPSPPLSQAIQFSYLYQPPPPQQHPPSPPQQPQLYHHQQHHVQLNGLTNHSSENVHHNLYSQYQKNSAPQIAVQSSTPQNEVRTQALITRLPVKPTNKSGRRSPQPFNQYTPSFSQFSTRSSSIPGMFYLQISICFLFLWFRIMHR